MYVGSCIESEAGEACASFVGTFSDILCFNAACQLYTSLKCIGTDAVDRTTRYVYEVCAISECTGRNKKLIVGII